MNAYVARCRRFQELREAEEETSRRQAAAFDVKAAARANLERIEEDEWAYWKIMRDRVDAAESLAEEHGHETARQRLERARSQP